VYDVFDTANQDEQLFVGVVSDGQWQAFCRVLNLDDFASDESLAKNNSRVLQRNRILPRLKSIFHRMTRTELVAKLEEISLPFAPINRPEDLLDDPHLNAGGGFVELTLDNGQKARVPALPLEIDGVRARLRLDLPQPGNDCAINGPQTT
jgi:crotonobetainyl-CoA:carnitine CoA-transferase CaiB-like acyl-CoA transferase